MKKIIISILLVCCFATGSIFAYDYNLKLNTEQYINMINTNMAEMTAEIEEGREKATLGTIFFDGGIEEGYIKPSISNDTKLKKCISGLIDNIKDTKIVDRNLQNKHNELMQCMEDLINLLDNTIQCKTDILNSNNNKLTKAQNLLLQDEKNIKEVNDKIDKINKIYMEINNFNKMTR